MKKKPKTIKQRLARRAIKATEQAMKWLGIMYYNRPCLVALVPYDGENEPCLRVDYRGAGPWG